MNEKRKVPDKVVARLINYRSLLKQFASSGAQNVYSHQLGEMAGGTAAQVRRDLMEIGYTGNPRKGYSVQDLIACTERFLNAPGGTVMVLVGVGNLGRALLSHFAAMKPQFQIAAAFDADPSKTNRVLCGCRCHPMSELRAVVKQQPVDLGIITVPSGEAQKVAEQLVAAGLRGVVTFAPTRLKVPHGVFVEYMDMATACEKIGFFARHSI